MKYKYCPYCRRKGVSDNGVIFHCKYCGKTYKHWSYDGKGYEGYCKAWEDKTEE